MYISKNAKALIKRALRPLRPVRALILRPVEQRLSAIEASLRQQVLPLLDRVTDGRLSALDAAVSGLEPRLAGIETGWRQHVPELLNAASSVGALACRLSAAQRDADKKIEEAWKRITELGSELAAAQNDANKKIDALWKASDNSLGDIGRLWQRLEFIRKEILYEFKYGSKSLQPQSARVISTEKVERARLSEIKVNLGCGHVPLEDYLNIDQRELPGVDIVGDVGALPFEEGSLKEIFSAHVLEHFPQQKLRRLLSYWRGLLAQNGIFRAIVPDGEAMLAGIADGTYRFNDFREVLFGSQEYEGDFHFNLLTPESLVELLKEARFSAIAVPVRARKNGLCYEFEVSAQRHA